MSSMKVTADQALKMHKVSSLTQWLKIYRLYRSAFPVSERKPFMLILRMWRRNKSDVWYAMEGRRFAGFAVTINGDGLILLDYLAVVQGLRARGVGSYILRMLKNHYAPRGLFVEIESEYEEAANQEERIRRKNFYVSNGMLPSRVMADVFGVKMELLCWDCSVDFSTYHSFYAANYSEWAAAHIREAEYPA